jgi:multiple sugar transport system permease protein
MMVGYFSSIPRDLDDRRLQPFRRAVPHRVAAFVVSWSELLFAISLTTETSMRTRSAGPKPKF